MQTVYCDSGGYRRELRDLVARGLVELTTYAYENSTKKIPLRAPGSNPTWDEGDSTWADETGTWDDYHESEHLSQILELVGRNNIRDAKHLDSAYRAKCKAFLTSDNDDIASKAIEIYALLGIRVFHATRDWAAFISYVENAT